MVSKNVISNRFNVQNKSHTNSLETLLAEAEMAINKIDKKVRNDIINEIY